ncbi:YecA family protein [Cyclobacterium marinum]|uniref:YecA family protein n=1 Tax=Cyclobacterium marinum TaxID=104 RepID=UPI001659D178|nr:SEC-C metal-binding domain-containing protein [Cyclobacterium marinum]MBI0397793.1 SEC-C domain-containing protein [Cyclobacterium marinum]
MELEENTFLCFQIYSLYEALYESPVFFLNENKKYSSTALKNRGDFTESFCFDKLKSIFGENRVFRNIEIVNKKNEPLSEIDILVLYGDIAIIVQAKSKRLTIESRKGNLSIIQKDFKLAIQDAYDQAGKTALSILNPNGRFRNSNKERFEIGNKIRKIYPIVLLSDYYPSLTIQTKEFLKLQDIGGLSLPVITEIFTLDIICEFLSSPLYFLSYIDRRANYFYEINITHELTVLSVHLTQNLWIDNGYQGVYYTEDCTADLDAAVLARKYDLPGNKTPIGILTKFKDTLFQKIITQLDQGETIQQIELGLFLLKLSEDTISNINSNLNLIIKQTHLDNGVHDFSLVFDELSSGITFHTSFSNLIEANQILDRHCVARKYKSKIDKWFGIHIHPTSNTIQIINYLDNKWAYSIELERLSKHLKHNTRNPAKSNHKSIGRNSLCPCGSGKKYKKCCL